MGIKQAVPFDNTCLEGTNRFLDENNESKGKK